MSIVLNRPTLTRINEFTPVTPVNYLELDLIRKGSDRSHVEHAIVSRPEWFVTQEDEPGIGRYPVGIVQWYINELNAGRITKYDSFFSTYIIREESSLEGGDSPLSIKNRLRTCTVMVRTAKQKSDASKDVVTAIIEYGDRVATLNKDRLDVKTIDGRHIFETWQRALGFGGVQIWRLTYRNVGKSFPFQDDDVPGNFQAALEALYQVRKKINRTHHRVYEPTEINRNFDPLTAMEGAYINANVAYVVNSVSCALEKKLKALPYTETPMEFAELLREIRTGAKVAMYEFPLTPLGIKAGFSFNATICDYLHSHHSFDADAFIAETDGAEVAGIKRGFKTWEDYRNWYYQNALN